MSDKEKDLDLRISRLRKELAEAEQEKSYLRSSEMQKNILNALLEQKPDR